MLKNRKAGTSIAILVFVLITLALSAMVLLVFVNDSKEEETIRSVEGVRKAHLTKIEAEFFVSQLVEDTLEEMNGWDEDNFRGNLSRNAEGMEDVEEEQGKVVEKARKKIIEDKYEIDKNGERIIISDFKFVINSVGDASKKSRESMDVIYKTDLEVELDLENIRENE